MPVSGFRGHNFQLSGLQFYGMLNTVEKVLETIGYNVRKDVANSVMYIEDCIWLPGILVKLFIKHRVTQKEVEDIFFNRPKYRFVESGYRKGGDVYSAAGQTDAGRYLIVFFIQKPNNLALILSARDMDQKERRRYEKN